MDDPPGLDAIMTALGASTDEQQRLNAPGALANAALFYAGMGWPIHPLEVGGKKPLTRWADEATCDLERVAAWWRQWPYANIGAVTGVAFDVIDIDAPDGFASFADYRAETEAAGHPVPALLGAAWTGNGGRHLLVAPTGMGNAAGLRPGLDYRGRGGFIVVPPSRLAPDGRSYHWIVAPKAELGIAA